MAAENDVTLMVDNKYYGNKIAEWNRDHPGQEVGQQQMMEWAEESQAYAIGRAEHFSYEH